LEQQCVARKQRIHLLTGSPVLQLDCCLGKTTSTQLIPHSKKIKIKIHHVSKYEILKREFNGSDLWESKNMHSIDLFINKI